MTNKSRLYKLAAAAVIGAIYAVLTMVLSPISYGPFQFRVSEVLCVLPFFFPGAAPGLFVGCAIANLMSDAGLLDIIFGSLATLLAGICTAAIGVRARKKAQELNKPVSWGSCIAACAMPVLFNAPIVGAVLAFTLSPDVFWESLVLFGGAVGLGELVIMYVMGLPLMRLVVKNETLSGYLAKLG